MALTYYANKYACRYLPLRLLLFSGPSSSTLLQLSSPSPPWPYVYKLTQISLPIVLPSSTTLCESPFAGFRPPCLIAAIYLQLIHGYRTITPLGPARCDHPLEILASFENMSYAASTARKSQPISRPCHCDLICTPHRSLPFYRQILYNGRLRVSCRR